MASSTRGRLPPLTSRLRRVRNDPSHYRLGRRALIGEGVLLALFGGIAIAEMPTQPRLGSAGVMLLGLRVTPMQAGVLAAFGIVAVLSAFTRRSAVWFSGVAATASMALTIWAAVAAAHGHPGPMGFDARDCVLYGVLGAYNLGLLIYLNPDEIEGPAWVPAERHERDRGTR